MSDKPNEERPRKWEQPDVLALAVRLSLYPLLAPIPGGGLLVDFVTQAVPNQRVDRLAAFAQALADRLDNVEAFYQKTRRSVGLHVLHEEATTAAANTASPLKRQKIVELLRTGLSKDEAELSTHRDLLGILNQLSPEELVIFVFYGCYAYGGDEANQREYLQRHAEVVRVGRVNDRSQHATIFEYRRNRLISLGLLDPDREGPIRTPDLQRPAASRLGRLLLIAIGEEPKG